MQARTASHDIISLGIQPKVESSMILVTGATGFIGQHLVTWLSSQQHLLTCLVRPSYHERQFAPGVAVRIVAGNVDDPPALRLAMHDVTAVIHLTAARNGDDDQTLEATNVQGTQNVIEAMHEAGVTRLIALSPIGADTHSAYAFLRSKGLADDLVRRSELNYTLIQSSAVYGPGDHWTEAIATLLRRWPFAFPIAGDGKGRLQPIAVSDLLTCFGKCLTEPKTIKATFLVGGPQHLTYDEMVSVIMEATRHRRRKRYLRPANAVSYARFLSSLIGGNPIYAPADLDLLAVDRTTTLDAVAYQFGFSPVRMANALDYLKPQPHHRR